MDVPKPAPRPVAVLHASEHGSKPKVNHQEESVWLGPVGLYTLNSVDP
jgi:hypothetical protein